MTAEVLLAVPNISEGRDERLVRHIAGTRALLDVSSDPDHNRSVLTYGGAPETVVDACVAMIERAVASLDIREHEGVHPRYGVVDVLPFVAYEVDADVAISAANDIVWRIAQGPGVPVLTYGAERSLPQLRRELRENPPLTHPSAGVICVGVRQPLVAFNVNLRGGLEQAKRIARRIRSKQIRALGFELPSRGLVQVSMNLVEPLRVGLVAAYEAVAQLTEAIVDCEVVGLVSDDVSVESLPLRRAVRTIEQALTDAEP